MHCDLSQNVSLANVTLPLRYYCSIEVFSVCCTKIIYVFVIFVVFHVSGTVLDNVVVVTKE